MDSDNEDHLNFGDEHEDLTQYEVSKFPNNCIGILSFTGKLQSNEKGTGFLVGSDLVLTVAHNIFGKKNNQEYLKNGQILFYAGVSGQLGSPYKVVDYRIPHQYRSCSKSERHKYDYALVKLDRKIVRDQYISLGTEFSGKGCELGLFGYQTKKCKQARATQSGLWKNCGHAFFDSFLRYKISSEKGNQGSPAMVKKDQQKIAVAIHQGSSKNSVNKDTNEARLITSEIVHNLIIWEREMFRSQLVFASLADLDTGKDPDSPASSPRSHSITKRSESPNPLRPKVPPPVAMSANGTGSFRWDPTTPFASNFLIEGRKVTMSKDDKSYQITSQQSIPKDSIANYRFKLLEYGSEDSVIIFGIITKVRKQQRSSLGLGEQSVGYQTSTQYKNAYIRIDGEEVQGWIGDGFVGVNNSLNMRVDTVKYQITFVNSVKPGKQFKYALKKKHWKGEEMYVYVTMRDKGDSVQIVEQ